MLVVMMGSSRSMMGGRRRGESWAAPLLVRTGPINGGLLALALALSLSCRGLSLLRPQLLQCGVFRLAHKVPTGSLGLDFRLLGSSILLLLLLRVGRRVGHRRVAMRRRRSMRRMSWMRRGRILVLLRWLRRLLGGLRGRLVLHRLLFLLLLLPHLVLDVRGRDRSRHCDDGSAS